MTVVPSGVQSLSYWVCEYNDSGSKKYDIKHVSSSLADRRCIAKRHDDMLRGFSLSAACIPKSANQLRDISLFLLPSDGDILLGFVLPTEHGIRRCIVSIICVLPMSVVSTMTVSDAVARIWNANDLTAIAMNEKICPDFLSFDDTGAGAAASPFFHKSVRWCSPADGYVQFNGVLRNLRYKPFSSGSRSWRYAAAVIFFCVCLMIGRSFFEKSSAVFPSAEKTEVRVADNIAAVMAKDVWLSAFIRADALLSAELVSVNDAFAGYQVADTHSLIVDEDRLKNALKETLDGEVRAGRNSFQARYRRPEASRDGRSFDAVKERLKSYFFTAGMLKPAIGSGKSLTEIVSSLSYDKGGVYSFIFATSVDSLYIAVLTDGTDILKRCLIWKANSPFICMAENPIDSITYDGHGNLEFPMRHDVVGKGIDEYLDAFLRQYEVERSQ